MPVFEITTPDGRTFDVEGPDAQGALAALTKAIGGSASASFADRFAGEGGGERKALEGGLIDKAEGMGRATRLESALTGAVDGMTFGFADEAAAGLNALVDYAKGNAPNGLGAAYDRRLASGRRQMRDAEAMNPGTYLTGQVAGGLATAPALPGGSGIMGGAKAGAAYGAVSGFGHGEGVNNRLVGAGVGGLTGAVVGAAVPAAIDGAGAAGRGLANAGRSVVGQARAALNPEAEALRRVGIARAADEALGGAADDAAVSAAQAAGQPIKAIDAGGETTRALARSAANSSPEARAILDEAISPRFESQAPRTIEFLRGLTGISDAGATREALQQAARASNRTAYSRAYAEGSRGVWDDALAQIAQAPAVQSEIRDATRRSANKAASQGFSPVKNPFVVGSDGSISLQSGAKPNLQFWDVVKQGLDDQINSLQRSGKGGEAGDLIGLRDTLRNRLDELVPSYKAARQGAAAAFQADSALEAGQKFVRSNVSNRDAARAIARMSGPERKLFAEGFASDLIDQINKTGDRQSVVNRIFGSPQSRQRIELALGRERAKEIEAFVRVENLMDVSRRAIQGNSTTTRQLVELGLAGGVGGAGLYSGDPTTAGLAALFAGFRYGQRKVDARLAKKVAELLASDDPKVMRQGLRLVSKSPRLMQALESAEAYIVRGLGPAANENISQPLTSRVSPALGRSAGASEDEQPQNQ